MEDSSCIVGTEVAVPMQGLRISLCVQKASGSMVFIMAAAALKMKPKLKKMSTTIGYQAV